MRREEAVAVRAWMRSYWSRWHLRSAVHALDLAAEIERRALAGELDADAWSPYRARVVSVVLLSVSFVEAAVNELYQDAADGVTEHFGELDDDLLCRLADRWPNLEANRRSTGYKIKTALDLAGAQPLSPEEPPGQDFDLVRRLRNAVVHPSPESALAGTAEEAPGTASAEWLDRLGGEDFTLCPFAGEGNAYFPAKVVGYGFSCWALQSCVALTDEFFDRMGTPPAYALTRRDVELERFDPTGPPAAP